jgi:hypothetical protein
MAEGFSGFVTTVTRKKGNGLIVTFDFLLKHVEDPVLAPGSFLEAVGATLDRMNVVETVCFLDGTYLINVTDATKGIVEVYDVDRVNHELDMEILAG